LVKIKGFPVEISELESALSEIQPVKHCAVTVGNDQRGARFLVAYVELDGGHYTPDYQRHALATIESEAPGLPRLGCDDRAATRAL
jgi:hypothetical protein